MDGVELKFDDIISLYTINDFEWRQYVSADILYYINKLLFIQ